jgi:restriction endonuclease S subunit
VEALYTTNEFTEQHKKYVLQKKDIILYSVGAYIGKANIFDSNIKATIGSFLTLLRVNEEIDPYYLLCFLNSPVGIMLTKRYQKGLAQQYIYPYDIEKFEIPIIGQKKQSCIATMIRDGRKLQIESRQLLETAKKAVETEIEKHEKD